MQSPSCNKIALLTTLLALIVAVLFAGQPAQVAQANVSRYFAKPDGTGDCYSWGSACSLQTAISKATSGKEIWVMKGTYTPGTNRTDTFTINNGVSVYGGFAGSETALGQRDLAANVTTLSGDIGTPGYHDDNSYAVVTLNGTAATALLDGFTVTQGASTSNGGGIFNLANSTAILQNITIVDNTAVSNGGGIYTDTHSNLSLVGVTLRGNSADSGGGILVPYHASANLTNVTLDSNIATNFGGGIDVGMEDGVTLVNLTVINNVAAHGGGVAIHTHAVVGLDNTILWGNIAPDSPQMSLASQTGATIDHSLVQDGCPSGATCTDLIPGDPLLGSLGLYGGAVPTSPLLPGSPAIDAGNNPTCAAADARGIARPQGAACDLGAFESRGFSLAKTGGDGQSGFLGADFSSPLGVAVSSSSGEPVNGGQVIFRGPADGAGIHLSPVSVSIANGAATFIPKANNNTGEFTVSAAAAGASTSLVFNLTNVLPPPSLRMIFLPCIKR
jgi:predicted outer membrane repeat protein